MAKLTLGWGIISTGLHPENKIAPAIARAAGAKLAAVYSRDQDRADAFAQKHGAEAAYHDLDSLLSDPRVGAVFISSPNSLHAQQGIQAARAGKHVLVEKPMAMSVAECESMIEVCQQNQVKLGVAYYRRFYPVVARISEILSAGELGQPLSVTAVTATPFNFQPGEDGYWRVLREEGVLHSPKS